MSKQGSVKTVVKDLSIFPKEKLLKAALAAAIENGCPVVFWRLPKTNELHVLISFSEAKKLDKVDLEAMPQGFIFSPFDNETKPQFFISGDFRISFDFDEVNSTYDFHKDAQNEKEIAVINSLFGWLEQHENPTNYHTQEQKSLPALPDYRQYVANCVEAIKENNVQKIVPARYKEIELSERFDPIEQWLALSKAYANAFVSLISIPEVGTWMGATPEILIEQKADVFRTVALAGTQKHYAEKPVSDTAWTQKEIEEQAMVSRYIINCFKKIRLREFEEKGPKTIVAGNLLHLKTEYEVNTSETNFPELAGVMLELLHPTSAVAGMPKASARALISEWEGFDREFYSGYLGPVHIDAHTNVFVNLRCMQLFKDKARLYAGAGVTEDSDPEKEFQETEIKFNTLLNIIQPST